MHIALCVRIITVYIAFSWVSKRKISSTNANTFISIVMDSLILKVSFNESSSSPPIALAAWRLVHWHGMLGRSKNPGKELATPPKTQSEKHAHASVLSLAQSCRIMKCLISQQCGHSTQGDFRNALSEGHTYVRVELAQSKWTFARTCASITVFHSMLLVNCCSISDFSINEGITRMAATSISGEG